MVHGFAIGVGHHQGSADGTLGADGAEQVGRFVAGRSGRTGVDLLVAFRTVSGFVMGLAQAQLADPLSSQDDGANPDVKRAQALAAERFPHLIEIAGAAAKVGADREFRAGLDIVMAGLTNEGERNARH